MSTTTKEVIGAGNRFQPFVFQSFEEVSNTPEERVEYVVEGLMPTGGLSVLAGKPKAGKSTLARQIAVSVATGKPFMGRKVEQGKVLYLALEEKRSEVVAHLTALGLQGGDPLGLIVGSIERANAVGMLEASLRLTADVKLVIIDPVFRFVTVKDSNDYVQVNNAMEGLMRLSREYGCHILTVHHMKKKETDDAMDGVLGSTAIAAAVDTYMALKANGAGQRILCTRQRYGTDMPATQLNWYPTTRSLGLGITVDEAEEQGKQETRKKIERSILQFISDNPDCEQSEVSASITGNAAIKKAVIRELVNSGVLIESGEGVKGAPFKYGIAALTHQM